jgi:hypothetical protein
MAIYNDLNDIVDVKIDIQNPQTNRSNFGIPLILTVQPGETAISGSFRTLDDIITAGFTKNDVGYKAAVVAFSQNPAPEYVVIVTDPDPTPAQEDIESTLNAALTNYQFYAICTALSLNDGANASTVYPLIADWAEENEKLFVYTAVAGANYYFLPTTYARSAGIVINGTQLDTNENNIFANVAFASKCLTYQSGSETWVHKTLELIDPYGWAKTNTATFKTNNLNWYTAYANENVTRSGVVANGEWIDVIRFRDWLVTQIQENVFEVFRRNPKVPYTDPGIALIQTAIISALKQGRENGGIPEDTVDNDGVVTPGFTVTVPRAIDIDPTVKQSRQLYNVYFTAKISGAVHFVQIRGVLTY